MKHDLTKILAEIAKELGIPDAEIRLDFPENPAHGEYTTNLAMLLSKRLKAPPREIAEKIIDSIKKKQNVSLSGSIDRMEVAGPGFINFFLSHGYFGNIISSVLKENDSYGMMINRASEAHQTIEKPEKIFRSSTVGRRAVVLPDSVQKNVDNKGIKTTSSAPHAGKTAIKAGVASFGKKSTVIVEFAHPNTHKAFHIGHLRNITTGETMVRLLESQGIRVIRANYQGDVGMHIAKAMYALLELSPYKDDVRTVTGIKKRVEFLGKAYAAGSKAFEDDEKAQGIIKDLNALIYASAQKYAKEVGRNPGTTDYLALVVNHVHPVETVYALWKETRQWSLDYFETIYSRVYTHYDRYYFESECLSGVDTAKDAVKKGILKKSDGAIIFDGKPHGIDTRVFVNNLGLPTYEAKELALAPMEVSEFGELTKLIHCVGPEQASFFTVTFKAEELLGIVKPGVQKHLIYGWVKLKHGKMSSRTGNVVLGEWLIEEVKKAVKVIIESNTSKQYDIDIDEVAEALAIGAIKYAFLKVSTTQEIAFDLTESINTNGDSGPYLMYCYARCKSVLRKAGVIPASEQESDTAIAWIPSQALDDELNPEEHILVRAIEQFPDVVRYAAENYAPNVVCSYLFGLAQSYNSFYAKHQIADNPTRLTITAATAQVIKNGLYLLGINVLERM